MEKNLIDIMPWIVTDPEPVLATLQEKGYQNRRLVFISGLNIDISPNKTKYSH